ncbi:hypothetical protein [Streptomyces sp. MMS24-I29]|uniref:hypothetical protein n=1 Tax=Streptomyces sp. MMS24-I29 TaxID=3351480 RepID=UPI003C79B757
MRIERIDELDMGRTERGAVLERHDGLFGPRAAHRVQEQVPHPVEAVLDREDLIEVRVVPVPVRTARDRE